MKRIVDLVVGLSALVMLVVPIVMVSILVKLTSKGSVLYWSDRVGRKKKIFRMPKFRTMRLDTPAVATHLMSDPDDYLSPIGDSQLHLLSETLSAHTRRDIYQLLFLQLKPNYLLPILKHYKYH